MTVERRVVSPVLLFSDRKGRVWFSEGGGREGRESVCCWWHDERNYDLTRVLGGRWEESHCLILGDKEAGGLNGGGGLTCSHGYVSSNLIVIGDR